MKEKQQDIDILLERNTAEQLSKVDWDKLQAAISARLDKSDQSESSTQKYQVIFKMAAGFVAAAAVVFVAIILVNKILPEKLQDTVSHVETVVLNASRSNTLGIQTDKLLADTDPKTILLTGQLHLFSNDPLLRPHSVWEQKPVCKLTNNNEKEIIQ